MIADVLEYKQDLNRAFLSPNGLMVPLSGLHKVVMVTADERIAELFQEISESDNKKDKKGPPLDIMVTPLSTGSKEYIQWVKE